MPEKKTIQRARRDKRQGKAPSTQAGEFVKEEIEHIRQGKHGARSTKQAIAIGLSKARRSGVRLPPPEKGQAPAETRTKAQRDLERGRTGRTQPRRGASPAKRARVTRSVLRREGTRAATHSALARQARSSAEKRGPADRSAAARKAARTKGPEGRSEAARKAARTRARRRG